MSLGKFAGPESAPSPKKMLYAPAFDDANEKAVFPAIVSGFAGVGDKTERASGEKNATAELPSEVVKETVSPLTTVTDGALGT